MLPIDEVINAFKASVVALKKNTFTQKEIRISNDAKNSLNHGCILVHIEFMLSRKKIFGRTKHRMRTLEVVHSVSLRHAAIENL